MATVPVTRTWVAGEVVTAAYMNNNITAVLGWLLAPAIVQARQLVAVSVANAGTGTLQTFTGEDVDSTGMHSTSVNTSRLTAVYPGWHMGFASISYAANATGRRGGVWNVNGTGLNGANTFVPAGVASQVVIPMRSILTFLNVGDYLEVKGYQDSGGALSTAISAGEQSLLSAVWVSN